MGKPVGHAIGSRLDSVSSSAAVTAIHCASTVPLIFDSGRRTGRATETRAGAGMAEGRNRRLHC
jgi:hypothetical protein